MIRHLRAFAWLRWRLLMNALERTGRRDRLQRFALATESLGPLLLGLVMVPSALGLAAAGFTMGMTLGRSGGVALVAAISVRLAAVVVLGMTLLSPLFSSVGRKPADLVRLLLLPIPRSTLFASELIAGLAEPWIALAAPMFLLVPVGLLVSGRLVPSLFALAAAIVFIGVLLGLALLTSTLAQILMRNRRRAELVAFILVFLPLLFSVPAMLDSQDRRAARAERRARGARVERAAPDLRRAAPLMRPGEGLLALVPSELYAATLARSTSAPAGAAAALGGLLLVAAGVHALSWSTYRRLLASPLAGSARETRIQSALWTRGVPGLSAAASAVAMAEVRLALRTPRGRIMLMMPLVLLVVFSLPMLTGREGLSFGDNAIESGLGLGLVVAVFGLAGLGPIALNQFAVDGAGLTLQLLAPIPDRDVLRGKAAGLALIGGAPILAGLGVAAAVFPPASPSLWLALLAGTLAAFFVLSPLWALVSATFPRAASLNSVRSSASNPHPAANFIGLGALVGAAAPPAGLAALAIGMFDRPDLVLPLVGLWCVAAYLIGRLLFVPATAAFTRRRENLVMVAQGR